MATKEQAQRNRGKLAVAAGLVVVFFAWRLHQGAVDNDNDYRNAAPAVRVAFNLKPTPGTAIWVAVAVAVAGVALVVWGVRRVRA